MLEVILLNFNCFDCNESNFIDLIGFDFNRYVIDFQSKLKRQIVKMSYFQTLIVLVVIQLNYNRFGCNE